MNQVTFIGMVTNAQGCAVSVILYQNGVPMWVHHYYASFNLPTMLSPGNYTVTITGYSQGSFMFEIVGASQVSPAVPANYQSTISDAFTFQVP